MPTVLIIDDEAAIRTALSQILSYESYRPLAAGSGPEAIEILSVEKVDAVLLDIKMPGMDGFEVLQKMNEIGCDMPVIVISGHGNIETAVEAVKAGAFDFLEKPLDRARMLLTLENCLRHRTLQIEALKLKDQSGYFTPMIGECPPMQEVRSFVERVAPSDATVLITGENGTGKEVLVRALHAGSRRRENPLIEVNCAAIPRDLVESELFGHEKGSFTGADKLRIGKFEQADGGTLFLDEIGDMSGEAQAKVLKAVEEGRFQRVGGGKSRDVDVRIIAATNRDLADPESGFRPDLYFRLNVLSIHLPPLRDRGGDVELLLDYFMGDMAARLNVPAKRFDPQVLDILGRYAWPGNIRELRNLVERLLILVPGETVHADDLPGLSETPAAVDPDAGSLFETDDFQHFKTTSETMYLQRKLEENAYNISKTAEKLGMQRSNLYKKISKYGLKTES